MFIVAMLTIALWVVVTYLTPVEKEETLDSFYQKVRPGGFGWKPVTRRNPNVKVDRELGMSVVAAFCATSIVCSFLPGVGNLILGHYKEAIICGVAAVVLAVLVNRLTRSPLDSPADP